MKLFEINTWPVALRWIMFFPLSILAFLLFYLVSLIGETRFPGGGFIFTLTVQLIGRPLTAYIGIYVVPKAKWGVGYCYIAVFIVDLISNILEIVNGSVEFSAKHAGNIIGILIGTTLTFIMIRSMKSTHNQNGKINNTLTAL